MQKLLLCLTLTALLFNSIFADEKAMYDAYNEVKSEYAAVKKQLAGLNPDENYDDKTKADAINVKLEALEKKVRDAGAVSKDLKGLDKINAVYFNDSISSRLIKQLQLGRQLTKYEKEAVESEASQKYNNVLSSRSVPTDAMTRIGGFSGGSSSTCRLCDGKGVIKGQLGKCQDCKGTGKAPETPEGGCYYCHGKGKVTIAGKLGPQKCPRCNGSGKSGDSSGPAVVFSR